MHKNSQLLTFPGFVLWVMVSLGLVAAFVLSPTLFAQPVKGLRLGTDLPLQLLVDREGRLGIDQVAALPDGAFARRETALNEGYTRSVYWLKVPAPALAATPDDPLWLEITPTYLDRVTLYQRVGAAWRASHSGDTVPMHGRAHVRQLVFPVEAGEPLVLRIETSSAMQVYGTVWRSTGLMAQLASVEWASGVHQGINLALALLICSTALALRTRSLAAMAALSLMLLVFGAMARGYPQVWLPERMAHWGNLAVSIGVFLLPAAFAWQGRELLTQGTAWRRIDRALLALIAAPLLAMACIPLGRFTEWAWLAVSVPWIVSVLCAYVACSNLRRQGASVVRVLMAAPYVLHVALGWHIAAAFVGLVHSGVEVAVLWQFEGLLFNILITVAVGVSLLQQHRESTARRAELLHSLARSEHALEERVRQRTAELLRTHNALQATLYSEQAMRLEQRQFFNMVSHEFRTPLAVIDSAATEQQSFPSADLAAQVESASQIRRACRRLTALVDNCLVSDRLDAGSFRLQPEATPVRALVEEAAQLVHWSPRHRLRLAVEDAPTDWVCDPTLARIALSNLVDNAVKYAQAGEIVVAARQPVPGVLELSVTDEGPGLSPETADRIFEAFERGHRADQTRGFGLGLWVSRRVARLHGGEVRAESSPGHGTRFLLTLPVHDKPAHQAGGARRPLQPALAFGTA